MSMISKGARTVLVSAMLAGSIAGLAAGGAAAQQPSDVLTTVYGGEGPEIEGVLSARSGELIKVITADGTTTTIAVDDETQVRSTGGFLGIGRKNLTTNELLNGLPVKVETLRMGDRLVASEIRFKSSDLETASMIRNATAQQFAEQGAAIDNNSIEIDKNAIGIGENAAATAALKSRFGDIGEYNVKGVTNVYFDSGKSSLSSRARADLCQIAGQADAIDNSLMLVVGYTDSSGSYELNQALSEKRAGRVVNFLQQECGWKPYRMLQPTGMAASDPMASNDTEAGKAQNRRVSVNILVSKALDNI